MLIAITSSLYISSCTGDNDPVTKTENDITQFIFSATDNTALNQDVIGAIDIGNNTIILNVPFGTDVTALQPTITISEGATLDPNTAARNFSTPRSYTVTSEAGNTKEYTVIATSINPERAALIAIYNANPAFQPFFGWDINDPNLENWQGVEMTNDKITSLTIVGGFDTFGLNQEIKLIRETNNIEVLPAEIGNLTELKTLKLSYTLINELPTTLGKLTTLETLDLYYNPNLNALPEEARNLTNLTSLNVDLTTINELPAALCERFLAEQLSVSPDKALCGYDTSRKERDALIAIYNANPQSQSVLGWDITATNVTEWKGVEVTNGRVTSLEIIGLSIRPLCKRRGLGQPDNNTTTWLTVLPPEIGNLTSLKTLRLTNNNLRELPIEIGKLSVLESLDICTNNINELPSEIGNLTNLVYLNIGYNRDLNVLPESIGDLKKLERIEVSATAIETVPRNFCVLVGDGLIVTSGGGEIIDQSILILSHCYIEYPEIYGQ